MKNTTRYHIDKKTKRKVQAEEKRLALMMRALKAVHSATSPESMTQKDLDHQRAGQELLGRLVTPMIGMRWEPFDLAGMKAAWVKPEWGHDPNKVILYCHGGGYTSGNLGYSRPLASKLSHITGWETLSFEYQGYGAKDITVAGDSAGGNLALVLCHRLKAAGRMLPGHLVLMSPWTDMTASGESYETRKELDPSITEDYIHAVRSAYAGDADITDPQLSPLYGDFTGFPPTLVQVGSNEILYSDTAMLRQKMTAAGVVCRMEEWQDMWHVFQMFPIKKAAHAIEHIGNFLLG